MPFLLTESLQFVGQCGYQLLKMYRLLFETKEETESTNFVVWAMISRVLTIGEFIILILFLQFTIHLLTVSAFRTQHLLYPVFDLPVSTL